MTEHLRASIENNEPLALGLSTEPRIVSELVSQPLTAAKQRLLGHLSQVREEGMIYWDDDGVIDRPVMIGSLPGRVRYLASFAYRQSVYEQRSRDLCSLCDLSERSPDAIELAEDDDTSAEFAGGFNQDFAIYPNNFPFLANQILVASREHHEEFVPDQYRKLISFMGHTGFAGAGMQLAGSGASIPDHAHISIFDESLPIFLSDYRQVKEGDGVTVGVSAEHPSLCYRIAGESEDAKLGQTLDMMRTLKGLGYSYNLYLDAKSDAYVIPRTQRFSPSLGTKVGLSLAAGTHNGYPEGLTTTDPEELKAAIWENCESITGDQLLAALRETTIQNEEPKYILDGAAAA